MRVRVNLDWEVPSWLKNGLHIGLPLLVLVGGAGVAWATYSQFKATDPLSASSINGLFNDLDGRMKILESAPKIGTVCGFSIATNGNLQDPSGATGYRAAKLICEAVTACGSSSLAHMCSSEEFTRSLQVGAVPASNSHGAWVSNPSGVTALYDTGQPVYDSSDCFGWTSGTAIFSGMAFWDYGNTGAANWKPYYGSNVSCDKEYYVACCK